MCLPGWLSRRLPRHRLLGEVLTEGLCSACGVSFLFPSLLNCRYFSSRVSSLLLIPLALSCPGEEDRAAGGAELR